MKEEYRPKTVLAPGVPWPTKYTVQDYNTRVCRYPEKAWALLNAIKAGNNTRAQLSTALGLAINSLETRLNKFVEKGILYTEQLTYTSRNRPINHYLLTPDYESCFHKYLTDTNGLQRDGRRKQEPVLVTN